ncbi:hypothetical protein ACFSKM_18930 [Ancylobacter dichloromethanicus]
MPAASLIDIAAPEVMRMPSIASAAAAPKRRLSGSASSRKPKAAVMKGSVA